VSPCHEDPRKPDQPICGKEVPVMCLEAAGTPIDVNTVAKAWGGSLDATGLCSSYAEEVIV